VIGLQIAAMFSTGTLSRMAFLPFVLRNGARTGIHSLFWWPARAALGDGGASVRSFGERRDVSRRHVWAAPALRLRMAAGSIPREAPAPGRRAVLPSRHAAGALRRKEVRLLLRDPWLMSQSLMQLLYLLPPACFCGGASRCRQRSRDLRTGADHGRQASWPAGLAWLTISARRARSVSSAPIALSQLLKAKVETVLGAIGLVFFPFVLLWLSCRRRTRWWQRAVIAAAALSSTPHTLWFRSREAQPVPPPHTSSRIATFRGAVLVDNVGGNRRHR